MSYNCDYRGIEIRQYKQLIRKELFRKSIHLCSALVPFFLQRFYVVTLILLISILFIYIFSELGRIHGKKIFIISIVTIAASRDRDANKFVLGPVTLVFGVLLTALLWDNKAAAVGIYCLAFGDGLASLIGKMLGTISVPFTEGKTVAGSLACFAASLCVICLYSGNTAFALCIAYAAMFIELLPLKDLDNLFIPVCIGFIAHLFF